jgi:hypothetical protein
MLTGTNNSKKTNVQKVSNSAQLLPGRLGIVAFLLRKSVAGGWGDDLYPVTIKSMRDTPES